VALAGVADEGRGANAAGHAQRRDGQLHRQAVPVLVQRVHLEAAAQHRAIARALQPRHAVQVRAAHLGRDDELVHRAPDGLVV